MSEMVERGAAAILAKVPLGYGMTRDEAKVYAKAVVEALEVPTDAMIQAAIHSGFEGNERHIVKDWQAMIRAALK